MLSVSVPERRCVGGLPAIAAIAATPLLVELFDVILGYHVPAAEIGWELIYVVFAAYLMLTSRYVSNRLIALGPLIDGLLDSPKASHDVGSWIRRVSPLWLQIPVCLVSAAGAAVVVGLVVGGSSSDPPVRAAWIWSVFVAMFFATDAVTWVVRYGLLIWQIGRRSPLAVHTAVPVQTPAIRELRDFSATLAAITGVGLFFFSAPLLWLLVYVEGHGVDITPLRTWSLVGFGICAAISLYAAAVPQVALAWMVGQQRDRILDDIDAAISKEGYEHLLDPEKNGKVVELRKLFDAITATRTSTIGVTAVAKWALGLLAPLLPFVLSWIGSRVGL
jgi:hypothetical protein